jgi:NAD(P)-dependent dehydrogenase (short-subunit alcohol dehydrogenase family)
MEADLPLPTPKTIVLTGCSSGFGRAIALRFAGRGWRVFATVRTKSGQSDLQAAAAKLGTPDALTSVLCDITDAEQIEHLRQVVSAATPQLDVLVNNAGTAYAGPVELLDLADLRRQFEVNVFGHVAVTQAFLPMLKAARGILVNMSSIGGLFSTPGLGAYSASKYALEALTDALRIEVAPFGVRVVLIEPGAAKTQLQATSRKHAAKLDQYRDGPYGPLIERFYELFAQFEQQAFDPEVVAGVVERVVNRSRPKPRYLVAPKERTTVMAHSYLPERVWDRQIRKLLHW